VARQRNSKPAAVDHPLRHRTGVTIVLEKDQETGRWMSFVRELDDLGTFGSTPEEVLDETVDLILGYVASMEDLGQKVRISRAAIEEIRRSRAA
jgi:predicted RNase H-like HicB family nuclease